MNNVWKMHFRLEYAVEIKTVCIIQNPARIFKKFELLFALMFIVSQLGFFALNHNKD